MLDKLLAFLNLFAIMDCRPKTEEVSDLGEKAKVVKDLSIVLECDESRVTHKVKINLLPLVVVSRC